MRMMIDMKIMAKTDLEVAKAISVTVHENYTDALDFIETKPDYSLLKFRKIIEEICTITARAKNIRLTSECRGLASEIDYLFKSKAISYELKNNLHNVRMNCNHGVHVGLMNNNGGKECCQKQHDIFLDKAAKVRQLTLTVFKELYQANNNESELVVTLVPVGKHQLKEFIFDATIKFDEKSKFKAGLLCESLHDTLLRESPLLVPHTISVQGDFLVKQALAFYDAAVMISADVDHNYKRLRLHNPDITYEEIICNHGKLEYLYNYGTLAVKMDLSKDLVKTGASYLRASAERGYAESEAFYGGYLYEVEKSYDRSFEFLTKAADKAVAFSYRLLSSYYCDGEATEKNDSLALSYIQKAINAGCADSKSDLAYAYLEGTYVEKDVEKARVLIDEARAEGSWHAESVYLHKFSGMQEKFIERGMEFAEELRKNVNVLKRKQNIRKLKRIPGVRK